MLKYFLPGISSVVFYLHMKTTLPQTAGAMPAQRQDLTGIKFRVERYNCEWTVLRYYRSGNWVCQEPDHGTTCHFHESEITPLQKLSPSEMAEIIALHVGDHRDEDFPETEREPDPFEGFIDDEATV